MSRPCIDALGALIVVFLLVGPPRAAAQEPPIAETLEREEAGTSRGGRAWGESDEQGPSEQQPAFHRYGHAFVTVGAGGTIRILSYADVCDDRVPGREGCRFSPPYLQLRGGWFFEGDGDIQHGAGLGVASNLSPDGTTGLGIDPFTQWVLSPSYFFRYHFDSWFQLMAHVGVPMAISYVTGGGQSATDFNWGLELQLGVVFKFLTGLGVYGAANVATWFAGVDMVWPTISFEGGLIFEYEVLP